MLVGGRLVVGAVGYIGRPNLTEQKLALGRRNRLRRNKPLVTSRASLLARTKPVQDAMTTVRVATILEARPDDGISGSVLVVTDMTVGAAGIVCGPAFPRQVKLHWDDTAFEFLDRRSRLVG